MGGSNCDGGKDAVMAYLASRVVVCGLCDDECSWPMSRTEGEASSRSFPLQLRRVFPSPCTCTQC